MIRRCMSSDIAPARDVPLSARAARARSLLAAGAVRSVARGSLLAGEFRAAGEQLARPRLHQVMRGAVCAPALVPVPLPLLAPDLSGPRRRGAATVARRWPQALAGGRAARIRRPSGARGWPSCRRALCWPREEDRARGRSCVRGLRRELLQERVSAPVQACRLERPQDLSQGAAGEWTRHLPPLERRFLRGRLWRGGARRGWRPVGRRWRR